MRFTNSDRDSDSSHIFYLRSKLSSLDFKTFQRIIWLWLGASGYQSPQILNRGNRRGRGSVGPDFLVRIGEDGIDVAVQIRHWTSPLTKRAVDELRGVLLRDKIPAGMIICPSKVSRAARFAAADFSGRPIRVIGIESLADSMMALGLSSPAFFRSIEAISLGLPAIERRKRPRRTVDFGSSPEGPQPDRAPWVMASLLLILLILWLVKGLLG